MVVRNKYGGYWNKTRSTVDSGGLSIPCMISITNIFQPTESPLILPYHAIPDITVPTETGDKLMPTQGRGFPGFLPVCMQGTWGWLSSQVCSFPTAWKSITCTHAYDHITWNNKFLQSEVMLWTCHRTHKNIMPGFRMLAFNVWKGRVHSFESFPLSPFPIWKNIQITNTSKTVQKVVPNIFEINLKIN